MGLKIRWIPRFGSWAASTRLRVFAIHQALTESYSDRCTSLLGAGDADVLIVQKAMEMAQLEALESFPGRLVYDFDDRIPETVGRWVAAHADLVTVDTPGRAADFAQRFGKPAQVLLDPIDYCPGRPLPPTRGEGACWFGNFANFEGARWMALALAQAGVPIRVIAEASGEGQHPYQHVAWDRESFPHQLRQSAAAFLSHAGGDPHKSENKAVAAITLGVPVLAHASASYEALAGLCGPAVAVVDSLQSLIGAWGCLGSLALGLPAAQAAVWATYHPRVIAGRLLELLDA